MRERINSIIQKASANDKWSKLYDCYIVMVAVLSLVPLMFKNSEQIWTLHVMDNVTVYLLFLDYILRWICYDYTTGEKGIKPFLIYPFSGYAIADLLSMLPSLGVLGPQFRILRVLRIVKIFHYSKNFVFIANVLKKEKRTLGSVLIIALVYIFVSALAMFTYEQNSFDNFFGALYWATTALTTVGYGDVYPVSNVGRLISMISSLFGIAVIALPAGIVTGGFLEEMSKSKEEIKEEEDAYQAEQRALEKRQMRERSTFTVKRYVLIMFLGVVINEVFSTICTSLKLPLWLDTIGTILVTMILEPAAGLLVGLADNFYLSVVLQDRTTLFYYVVSAAVVLIVGCFLMKQGQMNKKRVIPTIILVIVVSTILSTLLEIWRTGGVPTHGGELYICNLALTGGLPRWLACTVGIGVIKVMDTVATAVIVAVGYKCYGSFAKSRIQKG